MYWQHDRRYKAGGFWYCAAKQRKRVMDRYDEDPIHRISKQLAANARKRQRTLERMKGALSG